jgi:hypothetical protein
MQMQRTRRWLPFFFASLIFSLSLVSCNSGTGPVTPTGIQGHVRYGPVHSLVVLIDSIDYAPVKNVNLQVLDDKGTLLQTISTNANGDYRVVLPIGDYQILRMPLPGARPVCWPPTPNTPMRVHVGKQGMTTLDFHYETYKIA